MDDQVDNNILAERIKGMSADLSEIKIQMQRLAGDMERVVRLEERHATHTDALQRAFQRVEAVESRLVKMEVEMPITRMVRSWVISGVIGVIGLLGTQLMAVIWFVSKQMAN